MEAARTQAGVGWGGGLAVLFAAATARQPRFLSVWSRCISVLTKHVRSEVSSVNRMRTKPPPVVAPGCPRPHQDIYIYIYKKP